MAGKLSTILGRWEARDRGRDLEKAFGVGEDTILREFIKYLYIISYLTLPLYLRILVSDVLVVLGLDAGTFIWFLVRSSPDSSSVWISISLRASHVLEYKKLKFIQVIFYLLGSLDASVYEDWASVRLVEYMITGSFPSGNLEIRIRAPSTMCNISVDDEVNSSCPGGVGRITIMATYKYETVQI